uniref:Uncharacterized protein n=1 Tax=Rhizophora mucronata TaxID=61149 RepID=A0A2P2QKW8_RHIMU
MLSKLKFNSQMGVRIYAPHTQ